MDFNITVVGNTSVGKTTLIHRLLQCEDEDEPKRPYYHFKSGDFTFNLVETSGSLKKVNRLASKILKTDVIIFLFNIVEEDNKYMLEDDEEKPKTVYKSCLEALFELVRCMGLQKRIIYCLNKVDHDLVEYSPELIKRCKRALYTQIKGYFIDSLPQPMVVTSALKNENVLDNNNPDIDKTCIMEHLLKIAGEIADERRSSLIAKHLPLRLSVMCSHKVMGVGTIVQGNVVSGSVKRNDEVVIYPSGKTTKVKSIQKYGEERNSGTTTEIVALALQGVSRRDVPKGVVISHFNSTIKREYNAAVVTLNVLFSFNGFYKQYKFNLLGYNSHVPCTIHRIIKKVTYDVEYREENADDLRVDTGAVCTAEIRFEKPVFLEHYRELPELGRFILADNNVNVAYGVIDDLISLNNIH